MPSYNYIAINENGRSVRGVTMADNDIDLESRLKEIGLDLTRWKEVKDKKAGFASQVKLRDLIVMCLHMEQLERAGVPLHDALADVRDSTESLKLRDIMTDVTESVKAGTVFSEALAKYPNVFSEIFVGLIAAAEKTGNFSESFAHISAHMKWTNDIRRKVRKAMTYPIVVLFLMTGVISILMLFVVPQLIDFIQSQGFDIPIHTRALIATSNAFQEYWYFILGGPVILGAVTATLYRTIEGFAYWCDNVMLKIPVLGSTIRKINLARFTHFFGIMFRSGIDILESLEGASEVVNNRVIKEAIFTVRRSIEEGNKLTPSLRMSNQFPNLVIRMFGVGEESSRMNEAIENINFFYNREVDDAVDAMVGAVQPTLTAVMGLIIFWVIAAVFGPLYSSFQNMNF